MDPSRSTALQPASTCSCAGSRAAGSCKQGLSPSLKPHALNSTGLRGLDRKTAIKKELEARRSDWAPHPSLSWAWPLQQGEGSRDASPFLPRARALRVGQATPADVGALPAAFPQARLSRRPGTR